jgi:hypothetical protein
MPKLLTIEWFFYKASVGLALGFFLRMLEHWAWERNTENISSAKHFTLFTIRVLTQSICMGLPFAYLILIVVAKYAENETVLTVSAYLVTVLTSFLAVDLRELLWRISRM